MTRLPDEMTTGELAANLNEVEQAQKEMSASPEVTNYPPGKPHKKMRSRNEEATPTSRNRRALLQKGLGAAVAAVGAGALLEVSADTAFASSSSQPNSDGGVPEKFNSTSTKPGVTSSTTFSGEPAIVATSVVGNTPAVQVTGKNGAAGVSASSDTNSALSGTNNVSGIAAIAGVNNNTSGGVGVFGINGSGIGVAGQSSSGSGVNGKSSSGAGVNGQSSSGDGVVGTSGSGSGVYGVSSAYGIPAVGGYNNNTSGGVGVAGTVSNGTGVWGTSNNGTGVYGTGNPNAGYFNGNVAVTGSLSKGGGSFKIDHPQDPAHRYLYHSFVESPDMKNIYDGVVALDSQGEAEVQLPSWFGVLNADFRYQLTAIGAPGPNLFIAKEIRDNRFTIAGGHAGMKVSWMVTGIRQDAWANTYRIPVEQEKSEQEQGRYLHPELYGKPKEEGIGYVRLAELTTGDNPTK